MNNQIVMTKLQNLYIYLFIFIYNFVLQDVYNISDWPNICSLCLSFIVFLLSSKTENYLDKNWTTKFIDALFFNDNRTSITISQLIGAVSLGGVLCQVYQCLNTMDKLSAVVMLFWSLLFATNNFEILIHYKPKVKSIKLIK